MKKTSKYTQKLTCFCLHSGFWCFCLSVPVRLSITTASSMKKKGTSQFPASANWDREGIPWKRSKGSDRQQD